MSPVSVWAVNLVSHSTYSDIGSPVTVKKEILAEPVNEGLFTYSLFVEDIFAHH